MDWITDQVAIGNFRDAASVSSAEVSAIVCVAGCCDPDRVEPDVYVFELIDGPGNPPATFDGAVETVVDLLTSGERVLVHCHAGRSRSVCVVAAALMKTQGLSRSAAIATVAAKREISPTEAVLAHLVRYER